MNIADAKREANRMATSTRQALGPMFQHVSNFVREGVISVAESANLHNEVHPYDDKMVNGGERVYRSAKTMSEDIDQFKQIQESLRMKGYLTHFALKQVLPDVIESVHHCNIKHNSINNSRKQNHSSLIKINRFKRQQKRQQPEEIKISSHNKHHNVLVKTEKNGTCTWIKQYENRSELNPIRRRSVYDIDINRRSLQKRSFNARGA